MTLSRRILSILVLNLFALGIWAQETGKADVFSDEFQGSWTASQSTYNKDEFVAAHKSYEFGTILKVQVAGQDRAVNVRVVDRGPFKHGYILTLSRAAANELGYKDDDQRNVTIYVAREQGLAVTPTATSPSTSISTAPAQNIVTAPTQTQIITTVQQPTSASTVIDPRNEFASKGQATNIEVGTEYTTVVTKPTETVVTTNVVTTTAAPSVISAYSGYGLQVGSFIDYNNAMAEMANLKNTNINNIVLNTVVNKQGKTAYKLIIGPYSDRIEVEQYKVIAPQKYTNNSFIVDLSKMQ